MSFSLETEHVSTNESDLVKCKFCNRKFFAKSYEKHISSCERDWIRANCTEPKPSKESGPCIKAHVSGYEVQIKTFADMLSLGAERRKRWRLRHEEFIHTLKAARANCHKDSGDKSDLFCGLDPKIVQAGLTQCEYCKRSFNDGAYFKHVEQCKVKQTDTKVHPTDEQKEAKERFMKRMKYTTKLVGKEKSENEFCDPVEQSVNNVDTSGTNETNFNELIDKLADKLSSELKALQTPTAKISQTEMLNKIIKDNIVLLANATSQTSKSSSLPCASESNFAAPSSVVATGNLIPLEKLQPHNPTYTKDLNVQFSSGSNNPIGSISLPYSIGSSHQPNTSRKLSPPTADNNLGKINVLPTKCKKEVKSEVKVIIEDTDQSESQHLRRSMHHENLHKSPDANGNLSVVYYNYNESTSKFSPEQIKLHKKDQMEMNIPSKCRATGEGSLLQSLSLNLVPQVDVCERDGNINNLSQYVPKSRDSNVSSPQYLRSRGNSDTLKESQARNIELTSHHSNRHHHTPHPRNLGKPGNSPNTRSPNQSQAGQVDNTNTEGSSKKSRARYCPQCGVQFGPDARFCSSCGAIRKSKVSGGNVPIAAPVSQQMSTLN